MTVNDNSNRGWRFDNSYARLPDKLFSKLTPVPVKQPRLVLFNDALAAELGLAYRSADERNEIADVFSGNILPQGSEPLAQAYAGHQFGYFTMLGDGRAVVLGEQITPDNRRFDIQYKGSGRTPYSRSGDGRATLRAMLREYLISEAMHYLNIPSSRSLAVVKTGETVHREEVNEGAVLTRVLSSHIRVGTFEYIKNFLTPRELRQFLDYTIERHYPELKGSENPALELLTAVMHRQIDLVVNWLRVGFIHGVMNTDNMSVAGETFDYGPCAFMNAYDPGTVFSSIDAQGRYAFGNQPRIALWNLTRFADALLPLMHENAAEAVQLAENALNLFPEKYEQKWVRMMGNKTGFKNPSPEETKLILELLQWMQENKADYTNTFLALQSDSSAHSGVYTDEAFRKWVSQWQKKMKENGGSRDEVMALMRANNPVFIPRNYLVEQALDDAAGKNDFTLFHQLLDVFKSPYDLHEQYGSFQEPPKDGDVNYKTFCGT
jgi:serine/tyrosine/threonine adenylyltransferase